MDDQGPEITYTSMNHKLQSGVSDEHGYAVCESCGAHANSRKMAFPCLDGPVAMLLFRSVVDLLDKAKLPRARRTG